MLEEKVIECYSECADRTFIIKATYRDGICVKEVLAGFYWGEPDEEATKRYVDDMVAVYED